MKKHTEKALDGRWLICRDLDNTGKETGWANAPAAEAIEAVFPGLVQDNYEDFETGVAWYWNTFTLDEIPEDCDAFLKMGEAEYVAEYWVNGQYLGRKDGRHIYYDMPCGDALKAGQNLLSIRISVAGQEELDGYVYDDLPYLPRNTRNNGSIRPCGGIQYPVRLVFRPKVRTDYAAIRADIHTGKVEVAVTLYNGHQNTENATVAAKILSASGDSVAQCSKAYALSAGSTEDELRLQVAEPNLWDTQNPYLYTLQLSILQEEKILHTRIIRFGFREFCVKNGWHYLNGKRFYFTSACVPDGPMRMGGLVNTEMLYKELSQLKSMGFSGIRSHNGVERPEVLDMCDQMGIMVVQAHGASWHLRKDNPHLKEIFEYHLLHTVRSNINHPCIVAWEFVNESHHEPERQVARDALQALRKLDMTRLVYQGTGRWDNDMRYGSASNPGSLTWDGYMGAEDPNAQPPEGPVQGPLSHPELGEWTWYDDDLCCWHPDLGDVHLYARMPMTYRGKWALRNHGKGLKQPCYIAEFGSNSFGDSLMATRKMEQLHFTPKNICTKMCVAQGEFFQQEWERYGLGDLFPFPEDMVRAVDKEAASAAVTHIDCVRSNPHVNGFCFFPLAYGLNTGHGLLNWFRERRPYKAEAVTDCMAPLHWCVFVEPGYVYANEPFTVEAVLASQDVLGPGKYPVCARIQSVKTGKVWEYRTELNIEDPGDDLLPLAFPVFKETVKLDVPEGEYNLSVYLEKGGAPTGGRKTIYITEKPCGADKKASAIGLDEKTCNWLKAQGVELGNEGTILVGDMPDDEAAWDALYERIEKGATAVFLKPEAFLPHIEDRYVYMAHFEPKHLRLDNPGQIDFADSWAYRTNTIMKQHPYSAGLQLGVLNDDIYDQTEPIFVYQNIQTPDEVVSVTMAIPYFDKADDEIHGQLSGVAIGAYNYGKGKIVLNCYRILDELGKNPAADKLMINFL